MTEDAILARIRAIEIFIDTFLSQRISNMTIDDDRAHAGTAMEELLRAREEANEGTVADKQRLPGAMSKVLSKLGHRL